MRNGFLNALNLGVSRLSRIYRLLIGSRTFPSWAAASSRCRGYESELVTTVVAEKTKIFKSYLETTPVPTLDLSATRVMDALAPVMLSNPKKISVIDFGGGAGFHFFAARALLPKSIELDWRVVETVSMVASASLCASEGLSFFSDLDSALESELEVDLVLAGSVLQYLPNPIDQLGALVKIGAPSLHIARTPFMKGPARKIVIQRSRLAGNGPGPLPGSFHDQQIRYPATFEPIADVIKVLAPDYRIRYQTLESSNAFQVNRGYVQTFTLSCLRRES